MILKVQMENTNKKSTIVYSYQAQMMQKISKWIKENQHVDN